MRQNYFLAAVLLTFDFFAFMYIGAIYDYTLPMLFVLFIVLWLLINQFVANTIKYNNRGLNSYGK